MDQFRYIKIQSNTIDLSTRLWGINPTNSVVIPRSLVLRSIVLSWILLYWNWCILFKVSLVGYQRRVKIQGKLLNNRDFFFFRRFYNRSSPYICSIFYHGCCNRIYSSSIASNPHLQQKEDAELQTVRLFRKHNAQWPYRCNAVADPGVNLTKKEPQNF